MSGFVLPSTGTRHEGDLQECYQCCYGYPRQCVCGGTIHAELDEDGEGYFFALRHCDTCGSDYKEKGDE